MSGSAQSKQAPRILRGLSVTCISTSAADFANVANLVITRDSVAEAFPLKTALLCVDEEGRYSGEFFTVSLAGFIRQRGESDACLNRLLYEKGMLSPALSFKEQGELLFSLVGQKPNFICVPYGVFDFVQGILDFIAGLIPSQSDLAEYGRIGRYYAEQSMLVLDPATGKYSEELTPSYGRTDLRAFLTDALQWLKHPLDKLPQRSKGIQRPGIMGSGASIHEQIQNASQEELQEAMDKMPEEEQQKIKSCLSPEDLAKVEALKCLARENLLRAAADGTLERALQEIKEKHSQSAPPPPPA
ncbi:unnamed protein product [Cladocopium goreaui]|uniref:Divinyl chlorophyllide a 8-vinyl-reductase, chloroplastic n=1 Tax=Cladocopium goreaui TaxID=2562237 RepID=A0A9P1C033_9DINO|nr:unnamed protein product [Cladocopium goreaui]